MSDDFYARLDRREQENRLNRLFANRPDNLHDYQGCANDPTMQPHRPKQDALEGIEEPEGKQEGSEKMISFSTPQGPSWVRDRFLAEQSAGNTQGGGKRVGVRVDCTVCGLQKAPRGRSAPPMPYCDYDCPGYDSEPRVGDLWPGETEEDFGYPVCSHGTKTAASPALPTTPDLLQRMADALDSMMMNHSCPDCDECIEGRAVLDLYMQVRPTKEVRNG